MTPTGRAFLGAALGAVITLCLHPASRPFMIGLSVRVSPELIRDCVDSNAKKVVEPTNLAQAGLWMQLSAARIRHVNRLTEKERDSLLKIATVASSQDISNAFWYQMEAILLDDAGRTDKAALAWIQASKRVKWDDYQLQRLQQSRNAISDITGGTQAWQLAYLYGARSDDVSFCLERVVKHLLANAPFETPAGLELRFATLVNGDLVRQNARSTKTNIAATNITELAAFPSAYVDTVSPKRLWTGQNTIIVNLDKVLKKPFYAERARKIFSNTESWRALTVRDTNESDVAFSAFGSIISATIASASLVIGAIGTLIWLLGQFVEWRLARSKEIHWGVAAGIAVVLGGFVFFLTNYLPAAFAVALCATFLTVAPDRSRSVRPADLGPLFSFMGALLGLICSIMLITYFVASTPMAILILPNFGVPSDYLDTPVLAGLASVMFGLVLLMAPFWAIVHRVGTPYVLSLILKKFGSFMAVLGLTLSVILGPLCFYADRRLEHTLYEFVTNEPVHYYFSQ